jgi:threonine dehydrogenase-like Zn-dependent dehydrogenase
VVVFGCGPVGQFAIASALLMDAGRVLAVDTIPSRLDLARELGAEVIDFNAEDPVQVIKELTGGIGADRAIDAVGVDATQPHSGPAKKSVKNKVNELEREVKKVAPETNPKRGNWEPGDAPSLIFDWAVQSVAKAGTISIIGVYGQMSRTFPIGEAMNKNLTVTMGNCNHRKYAPMLVEMVRSGAFDPTAILTHTGPLVGAIEAYEQFDKRQPGWVKVMLEPQAAPSKAA